MQLLMFKMQPDMGALVDAGNRYLVRGLLDQEARQAAQRRGIADQLVGGRRRLGQRHRRSVIPRGSRADHSFWDAGLHERKAVFKRWSKQVDRQSGDNISPPNFISFTSSWPPTSSS